MKTALGTATTDGTGAFTATVHVPASAPSGTSRIQVKESPLGRIVTKKLVDD